MEKLWVLNPLSWPVWGALTDGGGRGLTTVGAGGGGGGVLVAGLRAMAGAATRKEPKATTAIAAPNRLREPGTGGDMAKLQR